MESIHKYKCLFYQTNAYQTSVIVQGAHNKDGWLVHFVLWALSSTVEIKNYSRSESPRVSLQTAAASKSCQI